MKKPDPGRKIEDYLNYALREKEKEEKIRKRQKKEEKEKERKKLRKDITWRPDNNYNSKEERRNKRINRLKKIGAIAILVPIVSTMTYIGINGIQIGNSRFGLINSDINIGSSNYRILSPSATDTKNYDNNSDYSTRYSYKTNKKRQERRTKEGLVLKEGNLENTIADFFIYFGTENRYWSYMTFTPKKSYTVKELEVILRGSKSEGEIKGYIAESYNGFPEETVIAESTNSIKSDKIETLTSSFLFEGCRVERGKQYAIILAEIGPYITNASLGVKSAEGISKESSGFRNEKEWRKYDDNTTPIFNAYGKK